MAAREQEQRELEESLDVVRTELSRTEQARKDASIKVGPRAAHFLDPNQVLIGIQMNFHHTFFVLNTLKQSKQ